MAARSGSASSPATVPETTKVIYIMGAARSGSTILGVTLGNCEHTFFAGELRGWLETDGVPGVGGEKRMEFWSAVRAQIEPPQMLSGGEAQKVERTLSLLHPGNWPKRARLLARYRQVADDLFATVARTAGVTHVIDSSSYPLRARELKKVAGIELYLIYLVRNPHSVIASFTGPEWRFSGSPLRTNGYLWLTTLLSSVVFLGHRRDRRVFVRHEDFIADPETVLRSVLDCAQLDVELPELSALDSGIHYGGNRLLRHGEVAALRSAPELPARRLLMTTLLQRPWQPILALLRPAARTASRSPRSHGHEPSPAPESS
jgi:hypothetical protein